MGGFTCGIESIYKMTTSVIDGFWIHNRGSRAFTHGDILQHKTDWYDPKESLDETEVQYMICWKKIIHPEQRHRCLCR